MSWRTLVSRPSVPSWPRKYLLTTTLVASWDQVFGISTSFCSKMTSPFSLLIAASRSSHSTASYGWTSGAVNTRSKFNPIGFWAMTASSPLLLPVSTAPCSSPPVDSVRTVTASPLPKTQGVID